MKPQVTLERTMTPDGTELILYERDGVFSIRVNGLELMTSRAHGSEEAMAELVLAQLKNRHPRVLVGGLGMGYTLQAVLDCLPKTAQVVVAELNPVVVEWCKGPLALLTDNAVSDPRVTVDINDVADVVRRAAKAGQGEKFDAVVFDLYKGPHFKTDKVKDPLYGSRAISNVYNGLKSGGLFTIWGENYDEGFDKRLISAGFKTKSERPGRGGYRHVVFVAQK